MISVGYGTLSEMDTKTLQSLDYPTILNQLEQHCHFQPARDAVQRLTPLVDMEQIRQLQEETAEAVKLLDHQPGFTIGGARDLRPLLKDAVKGIVLDEARLLNIKYTLVAGRKLRRFFDKQQESFPLLFELAGHLPQSTGLISLISQSISDEERVLDEASSALAQIRRDLKVQHNRLQKRIESMVKNPAVAKHLQEPIVTQRNNRYVLPVRADARKIVHGIVHDQSASGATLYIEPQQMVDGSNRYRQLELEEKNEVQRILKAISSRVAEKKEALISLVEILIDLDLALARGRYAEELGAVKPVLRPFPKKIQPGHPGVVLRLFSARHPLLDSGSVVPIDVALDDQTYALIITGPNTGGKTVTLKTVGLLALMAQTGLHLPCASGSELSLFSNIFADIGDEQSIEQSLSTFSSHITKIISILEKADRCSLVILDELGAGTDPQEGAALARALMTFLLERGITTLVTTHHPDLKAYAHATPGVINASVEFDLDSLQPTYHLTVGLPGRSNALAIARRLGLPEEIVTKAKSSLDPSDLRADDLLEEIRHQRQLSEEARQAAERARQEAEELREQLAKRLDEIEEERVDTLESIRLEAREELNLLTEKVHQLQSRLSEQSLGKEEVSDLEEKIDQVEKKVSQPVERSRPAPLPGPSRPVEVGDWVLVRSLDKEGAVQSLNGDDAEIQVGSIRVRADLADLRHAENLQQESSEGDRPSTIRTPRDVSSPGTELDLRGQRVDEALNNLEYYLDKAFIAGLPYVRIIHGMGMGRLRSAVRKAAQSHPQVVSYQSGEEREGGDGVTVITLQE